MNIWIFLLFLLRSCDKQTFHSSGCYIHDLITEFQTSKCCSRADETEAFLRSLWEQLWNDPACGDILLGWFSQTYRRSWGGWLWLPLISVLRTGGLCHRSPLELHGQLCQMLPGTIWARKKSFPQESGSYQSMRCKNLVTSSWERRGQTAVSCSQVHRGWMT